MLILIQDSTCQLKKSSLISAERVNSQQTIKSNQTNVVFLVVKLLSGWTRAKLPPTGLVLMTNDILRQSADCALILSNNRTVLQSCSCPYGRFYTTQMRFSLCTPQTANKRPQYGGNNGDLSGAFQNGISL